MVSGTSSSSSSSSLKFLVLLIFFFLQARCANDRFAIIEFSSSSSSSSSSSDRVSEEGSWFFYFLFEVSESEKTCNKVHGLFPCSSTVVGNLFLIFVYGYFGSVGARRLEFGSGLLLDVLGAHRRFLHLVVALLDAFCLLVSGLSGSEDTVQNQVLVGTGLLVGSNVMLLTLLWGTCIIAGKSDLNDSTTIDTQDTKWFSLRGSGVSTDIWTSYAARIMTMSAIPFVISLLSQLFYLSSWRSLAFLTSIIVAVALLLFYCLYQVFQPKIQKKWLAYSKHKHVISATIRLLKKQALGKLHTDDGKLNVVVVKSLFSTIDQDGDKLLSASELKHLIIRIQVENIDLDQDDAAQKVLAEFDTSGDAFVDEQEFIEGISGWLNQMKDSVGPLCLPGSYTEKLIENFHVKIEEEHGLLGVQSNDAVVAVKNPRWTSIKAVLLLILGSFIASAFADSLIDAVNNFSAATDIPLLFVSFVALPLATSCSESVSAVIFVSHKQKKTASLTFSKIYGAVTMNNILHLSVFLLLVYMRNLTWEFSSEVLIIPIICILMGLFASFRTVFPLWTFSVAYALYIFSLVLVYVLNYVFGWSNSHNWRQPLDFCGIFFETCFT